MKKHLILAILIALLSTQSYSQSLYGDIKAREIGDVLSVIISESANATRASSSSSSSNTQIDANAGTSGNLTDFLPLFGANAALSNSYNGDDDSNQKERLSGRITVRITEKTPGGMYRIAGERNLNVNGEENMMVLEGYIRARDISANNQVFSYNVADAQITYKKGGITNIVNDSFWSNTFVRVAGLVMLAVSVGALTL